MVLANASGFDSVNRDCCELFSLICDNFFQNLGIIPFLKRNIIAKIPLLFLDILSKRQILF